MEDHSEEEASHSPIGEDTSLKNDVTFILDNMEVFCMKHNMSMYHLVVALLLTVSNLSKGKVDKDKPQIFFNPNKEYIC